MKATNPFEEYLATRRAAGLFDFSFMGHWEIAGPRALEFLQALQTRNLARVKPGQLVYTLLLNEAGSVFIDATVWRLEADRFWLFTGRRSDGEWLRKHSSARCQPVDRSGEHTVLALQGPASSAILARLAGYDSVRSLRYFHFGHAQVSGLRILVGRLGFSGEFGYELIVPSEEGKALQEVVLTAGSEQGVRACGFEAADVLRVEAGYVLFGREIDGKTDPFELGLARLVEFDSREFIGMRALWTRRLVQPAKVLRGFEIEARALFMPPAGHSMSAYLTSEVWSPLLGRRIGLGFGRASTRIRARSFRSTMGGEREWLDCHSTIRRAVLTKRAATRPKGSRTARRFLVNRALGANRTRRC